VATSLPSGPHHYELYLRLDEPQVVVLDFKTSSVIAHFRHQVFNTLDQRVALLEGGIGDPAPGDYFLRHGKRMELPAGYYRIETELSSPFFLALPVPVVYPEAYYQQQLRQSQAVTLVGMGVFFALAFYFLAMGMWRRASTNLLFASVIIGALLSLGAVAIYSIPYNIIIRATLIPYSWYSVLFPRLAAASEKNARDLLKFGSRMLLLTVTPAAVAGLLVLRPFLELWIGKDIANEATPPGLVLMAGFWFHALTFMPLAYFQARERARVPALTYVAEIVVFAPLLYFLIVSFGIVGAAVAWLLRVALDGAIQFGVAGQLRTYLTNLALGIPAVGLALVWEIWSVAKPYAYTGKGLIFLATIAYILLLTTTEERSRAVGFSRSLFRPKQ
jgi:hypothetical protein